MQERHIQFYSHILGKNIDVLISGYWGYPILMFPTSMGNYLQNKDFGLNDSIAAQVNEGKFKLYNVDSIDFQSFYAKDLAPAIRIYNYNLYTRFLAEEFVPYLQRECNVARVAVAGCSFGGYHCFNFAMKYPDLVSYCFSMSGSFEIKSFMKGYYDDNVYFNNPVDFMPQAEGWKYNHMGIVLGTSDWDICRQDNIQMSRILAEKGIDHWYDERKWASHDWPLWKMVFPDYVSRINV